MVSDVSASPVRAASAMGLLRRLWRHLSAHRRRQLAVLMVMMVVSGFAEVVSLGAVLPFLAVLTAPEHVFQYSIVARFAQSTGWTSPDQLLLPLTIGFSAVAMIAGGIRLILLWGSTSLAFSCGADLSSDVYRRTLYQPYRVHISRNSSEVVAGIAIKVMAAVGMLNAVLVFASSVVAIIAILVALLMIDTVVALQAMFGFGIAYVALTWLTRRKLRANSERIAREQTQVVKALQEGLGGIRDVLLDGTQETYVEVFKRADAPRRRAEGSNLFIGTAPRHIMEVVAMVGIAVLAYSLSSAPGGLSGALPVLGALALGGQRLLPSLQQAYYAWAAMIGGQASLADTINLLDQIVAPEYLEPTPAPLALRESIELRNLRFRYHDDGPWVVNGLDLKIPRGARVGFVGSTGSGKSTTIDLVMGLLTPTDGQVLVDGESVTRARIRAWQRTIAHVPQSIFLADVSIAENIAFGVPRTEIDMEKVRRAASLAQIDHFIAGRPRGYDEIIGERGVRLSGGQRQRVGIARALYKDASVLVLDEATSALDNATERAVMDAIDGFNRGLTILMIAHRLTTVSACDFIVEMERGRVVAQGNFDELIEVSPSFRLLARAAS